MYGFAMRASNSVLWRHPTRHGAITFSTTRRQQMAPRGAARHSRRSVRRIRRDEKRSSARRPHHQTTPLWSREASFPGICADTRRSFPYGISQRNSDEDPAEVAGEMSPTVISHETRDASRYPRLTENGGRVAY